MAYSACDDDGSMSSSKKSDGSMRRSKEKNREERNSQGILLCFWANEAYPSILDMQRFSNELRIDRPCVRKTIESICVMIIIFAF